jgi:hypothetical protein
MAATTLISNQLQSDYPDREILDYMERQSVLFEQMKPELLMQYSNQFIWFEDGQVLDADQNHEALVLRAYGEGEPRSLFVKKVVPVESTLFVRSPLRLGLS